MVSKKGKKRIVDTRDTRTEEEKGDAAALLDMMQSMSGTTSKDKKQEPQKEVLDAYSREGVNMLLDMNQIKTHEELMGRFIFESLEIYKQCQTVGKDQQYSIYMRANLMRTLDRIDIGIAEMGDGTDIKKDAATIVLDLKKGLDEYIKVLDKEIRKGINPYTNLDQAIEKSELKKVSNILRGNNNTEYSSAWTTLARILKNIGLGPLERFCNKRHEESLKSSVKKVVKQTGVSQGLDKIAEAQQRVNSIAEKSVNTITRGESKSR